MFCIQVIEEFQDSLVGEGVLLGELEKLGSEGRALCGVVYILGSSVEEAPIFNGFDMDAALEEKANKAWGGLNYVRYCGTFLASEPTAGGGTRSLRVDSDAWAMLNSIVFVNVIRVYGMSHWVLTDTVARIFSFMIFLSQKMVDSRSGWLGRGVYLDNGEAVQLWRGVFRGGKIIDE